MNDKGAPLYTVSSLRGGDVQVWAHHMEVLQAVRSRSVFARAETEFSSFELGREGVKELFAQAWARKQKMLAGSSCPRCYARNGGRPDPCSADCCQLRAKLLRIGYDVLHDAMTEVEAPQQSAPFPWRSLFVGVGISFFLGCVHSPKPVQGVVFLALVLIIIIEVSEIRSQQEGLI